MYVDKLYIWFISSCKGEAEAICDNLVIINVLRVCGFAVLSILYLTFLQIVRNGSYGHDFLFVFLLQNFLKTACVACIVGFGL